MPDMAMAKLDTKPRTSVDMIVMQIIVNPLSGTHYKPKQAENLTCLDNQEIPRKPIRCMDMPRQCQAKPNTCRGVEQ